MAVRFRTRFLHATIVDIVRENLLTLGWAADPVNFSTHPVRVIDYQPDDRAERVAVNTVAVTIGDVGNAVDEELGASHGGLRSQEYPIFIDVYMEEQALSVALIDDLRDVFTDAIFPLRDKIHGGDVPAAQVAVEEVIGPERPPAASSNDHFKRYWRILRLGVVLYYNT